jgi:DMSO/TMAO reductase YedYZ molybdopterin-dependent catalytic subunit
VGVVSFISRGFKGRRRTEGVAGRLPPGQYVVDGFPVLSAGPTPRTPLDRWDFSVVGQVDQARRWTWAEFLQLPAEEITRDIHCVTKWRHQGTPRQVVSRELPVVSPWL